jgi:hypothetical protein
MLIQTVKKLTNGCHRRRNRKQLMTHEQRIVAI